MTTTTLTIDRLSLEGDGVGRLSTTDADNGKVAFVPYVLPSEKVVAEAIFQKKSHSRWMPVKVLNASPIRVTPPCPHFFTPEKKTPACGGCNWQHLSYASQKETKRQLVIETLERIGGIVKPPVAPLLSSENEWRYRNKVQVPFGGNARALLAGFYAPGSHVIVPFEDCQVQPDISVKIVQTVKKLAKILNWIPYEEDAHRGWLRHLLVRTNEIGQAIVVLVTLDASLKERSSFLKILREDCPGVIGIYQNVQHNRTNVILGRQWIKLWGADRLEEPILDLRLGYSPASFFQVNTKASEILYERAIRALEPTSAHVVLDLYCGVGAMTLLAAKRAKAAIGVEMASSSIADAIRNARDNKIANAQFIEADVERYLNPRENPVIEKIQCEKLLVLLDPPRTGCTPGIIEGLKWLSPEKIVYVSCNPATLARDIKLLASNYEVVSVTPVDLFPQTSHIESVTSLKRRT